MPTTQTTDEPSIVITYFIRLPAECRDPTSLFEIEFSELYRSTLSRYYFCLIATYIQTFLLSN